MIGNNVTLKVLLDKLVEGNGKVTIIDPIYDETRNLTHFDASYNMEMFFACVDAAPSGMTVEDVRAAPEEFDECLYYPVYAFMGPGGDVRDALPVTDISLTDDGRVLLFV